MNGMVRLDAGVPRTGDARRMTAARVWFAMAGRWRAVAGVAAGVATVLAGVGLMTSAGYLISRAAERPPILDLMVVFVAVRFFGLARPALRYVERLVSHDVTFRALRQVRRWFYDALLPLSPARVMDFRAGDLLARLASDVDSLQEIHLRLVAPALVALIVGGSAVSAIAFVDARLAGIVFLLLLASGVLWPLAANRWTRGLSVRRNRERAALSERLVPTLQGLEDLCTFGRAQDEVTRLMAHQHRLDEIEREEGRALAAHAGVGAAFAQMALWSALAVTLPLAADGRLSGVWVAAVALGIVAAFEAVEGLPAAWQFKERLDDAADRVFAVIDAQPAVSDPPDAALRGDTTSDADTGTGIGANAASLARPSQRASRHAASRDETPAFDEGTASASRGAGIRFQQVTFAHHRGDDASPARVDADVRRAGANLARASRVAALSEITFDVAPGEQVAIVGPSGGGKSTLLSLAMRVWDPISGNIDLDGRDLRGHRLADLRAALAVMPQQVYVFDDSLRENARLLRPGATDAEVAEALRRASLAPLLDALPRGLDTTLGEHGSRLSAGERQRLGLARLLLSRAPLALIDEPTANLDSRTERAVLRALHAWSRHRTLLLVTHRLVHLEAMDRIIVIDRGRIVEQGSHAELLARDGLFTRLLESQRGLLEA